MTLGGQTLASINLEDSLERKNYTDQKKEGVPQ